MQDVIIPETNVRTLHNDQVFRSTTNNSVCRYNYDNANNSVYIENSMVHS
jgi:hypothetical protein